MGADAHTACAMASLAIGSCPFPIHLAEQGATSIHTKRPAQPERIVDDYTATTRTTKDDGDDMGTLLADRATPNIFQDFLNTSDTIVAGLIAGKGATCTRRPAEVASPAQTNMVVSAKISTFEVGSTNTRRNSPMSKLPTCGHTG